MSQETWVDAAAVDELPADDVKGIEVGGFDIAFFKVGDDVWATSNSCTHGDGRLCDGFLEGHEIECPLHQGKFDVRSGKALCTPVSEDLRVFPVKIEGGRVFVALG
ncbi:non-heme iron oxygenase ferredoxin subunit [Variovorax sp. J22R133]|uniref:non-heme iron oxygenase ferredoxin subunit n=1 Tax=Variovorax brevis TaxID=3053503 RepID=UPI0025760DE1|nr:non-heme iron oxygenase ferredoxin subunit [Variovorax sp. J22R133]MDM0113483.1 non-heme iron oxygenase ferredoxin subunit [Variovorax sp. J22R133]